MDLRDATNWLLRTDDVGEQIRLADNYIQAYNRFKDRFTLPTEHSRLKPVIDSFASDISAFVDYIKALRDHSEGSARDELHSFYRTISVRALQNERRSRLRRAVAVLAPVAEKVLGGPMTYDEQLAASRFIETAWGSMRMKAMSDERNELRNSRLSTEERSNTLAAFWKYVEDELTEGRVPVGHYDTNKFLKDLAQQRSRRQ